MSVPEGMMRMVMTREEAKRLADMCFSLMAGRFPSQAEISLLPVEKLAAYLGATDGPKAYEFPTYRAAEESVG